MIRSKIVIVGPPANPIPAINGGAIETLVSALIDENEKYNKVEFVVFTRDFKNLKKETNKYKSTSFIRIRKGLLSKLYDFSNKLIRHVFRKYPYKTFYMAKVNGWLLRHKKSVGCVILETGSNEASQIKKIEGKCIYYHVHSDYLSNSTFNIDKILHNTDRFIAVSEFIKRQLLKVNGIDTNHVLVLKNAIDLKEKQYVDSELVEIRRKCQLIDDDFVVVFCGRLSPEKGCLELIEAVNKLDDVKLLVLGGETFGSNKTTSYVQKLRDISGDNIIFLGYVKHEEIYKYFRIASVGVVPSVCNEAASLTLLELRSCGLATIATKIGGIPEYSDESMTAYVEYNADFINNLSKTIQELKNDTVRRNRLSHNALNMLDDYSYEAYYLRFKDLIDDGQINI